MNRFARGWSVKRFERSNGMDTALYYIGTNLTFFFKNCKMRGCGVTPISGLSPRTISWDFSDVKENTFRCIKQVGKLFLRFVWGWVTKYLCKMCFVGQASTRPWQTARVARLWRFSANIAHRSRLTSATSSSVRGRLISWKTHNKCTVLVLFSSTPPPPPKTWCMTCEKKFMVNKLKKNCKSFVYESFYFLLAVAPLLASLPYQQEALFFRTSLPKSCFKTDVCFLLFCAWYEELSRVSVAYCGCFSSPIF